MEKQINNDEIDLVELLVKGVLVIKRNLRLITIFFAIGSGIGFSYSILAPKIYKSKVLISSDILTESYCEKIFETLQSLVKEKNYQELSDKLSLTTKEAESISKLNIESALKDKPEKEEDKRFFIITAEINDRTLFPKLQNGLIKFLQENDFVKVRVEQRKNYYRQLIEKSKIELKSLEEFKTDLYNGKFLKSISGNVMFDPTEVNSKIIQLSNKKFDWENALELVSSVQVVEGFTKFDKPIWPKKSISLAAGATLGLFLVGLLIAFKSIRKLVRFAEAHPSTKSEI